MFPIPAYRGNSLKHYSSLSAGRECQLQFCYYIKLGGNKQFTLTKMEKMGLLLARQTVFEPTKELFTDSFPLSFLSLRPLLYVLSHSRISKGKLTKGLSDSLTKVNISSSLKYCLTFPKKEGFVFA